MDEILLNKLANVDHLIDNGDLNNAVAVLKSLAQDYPDEGIVAYYLGRMSAIANDGVLALKYFLAAIDRGYTTTEVYLSAAMLQKMLSSSNDAEKSFIKATEAADTNELKWVSQSSLCVYYIENEMYLKAEKIVKKLIKDFPENYQGYHLHIIIEAVREHYDEAFAYMAMLPEAFKNHPQYLIDVIEIYKKASKEQELAKLFEDDLRFNMIVPQVVLKEKLASMPEDDFDAKEEIVRRLARDYHDKDAIVSVMILEFSKKNFKKSAQIANVILDNEKLNQGFRYYLALYFQIYNFYFMAEKKPSAALRSWIEKAGNWCINFAAEMGIPAATDIVSTSLQELFDEINAAGSAQ